MNSKKIKNVAVGIAAGTVIGTVLIPVEFGLGVLKAVLSPLTPLSTAILGGVLGATWPDKQSPLN